MPKPKKDLLKSKSIDRGRLGDVGSSLDVRVDRTGMTEDEVRHAREGMAVAASIPKTIPKGETIVIRKMPDHYRFYGDTYNRPTGEIGINLHKDALVDTPSAAAVLTHEGRHAHQLHERAARVNRGESVQDLSLPSTQLMMELDAYQHEFRNQGRTKASGPLSYSAHRNYRKLYDKARRMGLRSNRWEYPRR